MVAKSVEESQEKALAEVTWDGEDWMHTPGFREEPVIVDVEEPADWGDLQKADQTHLLPEEGQLEGVSDPTPPPSSTCPNKLSCS